MKLCMATFSAHNGFNFKLPWWLNPAVVSPLLLMAIPGYGALSATVLY